MKKARPVGEARELDEYRPCRVDHRGQRAGLFQSGSGGDAPGALYDEGVQQDLAQTTDGELTIELGGTGGSQFDQFQVTGTANLTGTLRVLLISSFTPNVGDQFEILTAGTVSGTFSNPMLPAGFNWSVDYSSGNSVVLEVMP